MGECPQTLSGRHVFSARQRAPGGEYVCLCGERTTRREAFEREVRAHGHRATGCPCRGSLNGCDFYELHNQLRWQERYLGYAEQAHQDAVHEHRRALEALRQAEQQLQHEQRRLDLLATDVDKPGDVA